MPCAGGDVIPHAPKLARPDSLEHNTHGIPTIHIMDGKPEQRQDQPREDGDVRAPEAPAGAGDDGERGVVDGPDGAVGSDDDRDDGERDGDDDQGVDVGEAYGEDAAGELPGGDVEGVGEPVC